MNDNMKEFLKSVQKALLQIEIPSFALIKYENIEIPLKSFRVLLKYTTHNSQILSDESFQKIDKSQLHPNVLFQNKKQYNLLVQALINQKEQLGFAIFELPRPTTTYGGDYAPPPPQMANVMPEMQQEMVGELNRLKKMKRTQRFKQLL